MRKAAVQLCELIQYRSAGTVEFIVDDETASFSFLELNSRIQVEHAVTSVSLTQTSFESVRVLILAFACGRRARAGRSSVQGSIS